MSFQFSMAHFYDALNDGADYETEREWIVSVLPQGAKRGLDLGCGTGTLSVLLSADYEMCAVDLSPEMLSVADEKVFSARRRVHFVCQDISALNLGETYDFCVCFHDTLNYLLSTKALSDTFCRVARHLNPGGVFLFDLSRKERFVTEYAQPAEVLERDGLFCVWEREYHASRRICDFVFHFFEEDSDGKYVRSVEYERQRVYAPKTVENLCRSAGFDVQLFQETDTHFIYLAKKRG